MYQGCLKSVPKAKYVARGILGNVQDLEWLIEDLQRVFIDNIRETRESFCSHKINITKVTDYVQDYTAALLSPRFRKDQIIEPIQKDFEGIKEMSQFFKTLQKYISWFNFDFIVQLVNHFITNNRDLLRKWSTYRDKLKDYFKNNNTRAFQIGESIQFGLSDVPGTKVMVAKVEKDDYTMSDLYFFHKAIAEALEVPKYQFYFCEIDHGCMELKYSIPDAIYSALFPLDQRESYKFKFSLAKTGITEMTFSGNYRIPVQQV